MNVEISITNAPAKSRLIETLSARGYAAASGPVRLAYPFTVLVEGVEAADMAGLWTVIGDVDPCAGTINMPVGSSTSTSVGLPA